MKTCLLLALLFATLSLGEAKRDETSITTVQTSNGWSLESPKNLLQRALLKQLAPELLADQGPHRNLRGASRQLEDQEGEEGEENQEGEESEEEGDQEDEQQEDENQDEDNNGEENENQDNEDGDNEGNQNEWQDNYDDEDQAEEADEADANESSCAMCNKFNSMSRASKIWTIILIVWGFIILVACLIFCVRACTSPSDKSVRGKKQPLMSGSVGTHNSDGTDESKQKGWCPRWGEKNRRKVQERKNRSYNRSRTGRRRSRNRGRN